ncbi:MAG: VCBS repeat-containing protein [Reichenbachiella sp.]|uniref:VCBS repeat-containing protein n=1 Tax=Reichenbachiella sp. TaxID=2184521 RepID=UPI003262E4BB
MTSKNIICLFSALLIVGCVEQEHNEDDTVFQRLDHSLSNIDFSNDLVVNDSVNFFNYGYYYMGGGVAVGDVNGDGLQDLYFTGNSVKNKLYLNKGDLQFEDITTAAGAGADNRWITGVAMHDINADGLMDISISVAGIWASTKNILYINQGVNDQGIPQFVDEAEDRGVADEGLTIQTAFFDADQDGDIDMYVANYEQTSFGTLIHQYKQKVDNPVWKSSDHLYINDGTGHFTDGTEKAGMLNFGLAVGVIASDFNNDNLTDLYVSNDFNTPDNFYFNNGDGTFTDLIKETTQHTSFYGMGIDAADINNDGLMDFVQMDMTPADNFRSKANMASMDIDGFWENVDAGFHYQYMYNALQLNQGVKKDGRPFFADVAKMSGIDKTDWSWACLFADYDNDGLSDLFVTNGTRRDINNKDFFKWMDRLDIKMKIKYKELTFTDITEKLPFHRMDNYIFKNMDGKNFEKSNQKWGIQFEGFSNGASYADLDNDGDVEIIINNIDSVASVFKNLSAENGKSNFLKLKLEGPDNNPLGLGAKIKLYTDQGVQFKEHTLVRGYQSSIEPILHFGLGLQDKVTKVEVSWPTGTKTILENVSANQTLTVSAELAKLASNEPRVEPRLFEEITVEGLEEYQNKENDFDDFDYQILLPHRMSRLGPAVAKADINKDGLEDLFIGGAKGIEPLLYIQNSEGGFVKTKFASMDSIYEDVSATFFDADGDQDMDLYVVSGGNDHEANSEYYQDRLYINEPSGLKKFTSLPEITLSGGVVLPFDYDQDGDEDLFIGGRQLPRQYPLPVNSLLLENLSETGELKFQLSDQPDFNELGMVTDATWIALDPSKDKKLVVVGEWMPMTIFGLSNGQFVNESDNYDLGNTTGWWNTIESADFDNDGDEDLVVGNLGLNYKYKATEEATFDIYVNDYDTNGNLDIVLGYYQGEEQYPVRGMQCSSQQIPDIQKKYKNKYNAFAQATLADIYGETHLESSIHYKVSNFSSLYIENNGDGSLIAKNLPFEIQTSSLNAVEVADFNGDGHLDILAGGNQFNSEIETPRNDACFGWLLAGDGKGEFSYVGYERSGLYVPYDIRNVARLKTRDAYLNVFISNSAPAVVYRNLK